MPVVGVLNMLGNLFKEQSPDFLLVAKDGAKKTRREKQFKDYKANRKDTPDDLIHQFEIIDDFIKISNIPYHLEEGEEADDIIGSAVMKFKSQVDNILIISSDKDLMYYIEDNKVTMVDTMRKKNYDEKAVFKKLGVHPKQVHDYLAIVGDGSDNIPGVAGIGAKGAADILSKYKNLDECLKNVDNLEKKRYQNSLKNHKESALFSRELVAINEEIKLKSLNDYKFHFSLNQKMINFLNKYGFKNLLVRWQRNANEEDKKEIIAKGELTQGLRLITEGEFKKIILGLGEDIAVDISFASENFPDLKVISLSFASKKNTYVIDDTKPSLMEKVLETLLGLKKTLIFEQSKMVYLYMIGRNKKLKAKIFDLCQAYFLSSELGKNNLETMSLHFFKPRT